MWILVVLWMASGMLAIVPSSSIIHAESEVFIWQSGDHVQLRWQAPSDDTRYHIERQDRDSQWQRLTPQPWSKTTFDDLPEPTARTLRYRVIAVDQQGREFDTVGDATIAFVPIPPSLQGPDFFDRNNIISDAEFLSSTSVTTSQVQTFLEQKGSWIKDYRLPDGRLASQAIVEEALRNEINPIIIVARLQMEQGLISKKTQPSQHQLDFALGYGCPDTAACDQQYKGFDRQVAQATANLRAYIREIDTNGQTRSGWAPGRAKDSLDPLSVTPANRATAALYTYTPWVGQGGGGGAGVGGNYLFWQLYLSLIHI
jgi:hypothetical protein